MKKIFIFIVLILLPISVSALEPNYTVNSYKADAKIEENGDMLVTEQITLTGDFNGYERDLGYKGDYKKYDPTSIQIISVCDDELGQDCYKVVSDAYLGQTGVYIQTDNNQYIRLRMYNYTKGGTKTFYIKYLLKNIVLVHNDIAELYYTFIGENMDDDIESVSINVTLPQEDPSARVWAHGPLNGSVDLYSNKTLVANISPLYHNNLVDIRFAFNKDMVPTDYKTSGEDGMANILAEEQTRADDANKQRETAQNIQLIVECASYVWIIGAVALFIYTFFKYDLERKSEFTSEYMRELPANYGPEVVEYLMKRRVSELGLSATLLNIIRKGMLKVEEELVGKKKQYVLVPGQLKPNEKLSDEEQFVYHWFMEELGGKNRLNLAGLKESLKELTAANEFVANYNTWNDMARAKGIEESFFESSMLFKALGILYGLSGIGAFILATNYGLASVAYFIVLIIGILLVIYMISFSKKTYYGIGQYLRWKAFKKFLLDFGRFDEKLLPEIALWEHFLVYATVFGIADKVAKEMRLKIEKMGVDQTVLPNYAMLYTHSGFGHELTRAVSGAKSASLNQIANSRSSSGGGFGGGFSSGGGFGGGGSGGGGRGF